ncbi:MAG TPA: hypothetical protein VGD69_24685 [Herpetosiphonaceae bacterium]
MRETQAAFNAAASYCATVAWLRGWTCWTRRTDDLRWHVSVISRRSDLRLRIGPHTADRCEDEDAAEQKRMPQHPPSALRYQSSMRAPRVVRSRPTIAVGQCSFVHSGNDERRRTPPLAGDIRQRARIDRVEGIAPRIMDETTGLAIAMDHLASLYHHTPSVRTPHIAMRWRQPGATPPGQDSAADHRRCAS